MIVRAFAGDSTMTRRLSFLFSATGGSRYRGVKLLNTPRMRPSPLYNVIGVLSWPVLWASTGCGREAWSNVPAAGGCVLACNHVSSFDPWPLGMPLWPKRQLRFMAKSELYWWPLDADPERRGAFPGAPGPARRRRDRDRRAPRARRASRRDVPGGHAPDEGAREALRGAPAHRRGAHRARGRRPARARGGRREPTSCCGSARSASPTARRSTIDDLRGREIGEAAQSKRPSG